MTHEFDYFDEYPSEDPFKEATMSHGHFVERCKVCGDVVAQCRCGAKEKETRWTTCSQCLKIAPENPKR